MWFLYRYVVRKNISRFATHKALKKSNDSKANVMKTGFRPRTWGKRTETTNKQNPGDRIRRWQGLIQNTFKSSQIKNNSFFLNTAKEVGCRPINLTIVNDCNQLKASLYRTRLQAQLEILLWPCLVI